MESETTFARDKEPEVPLATRDEELDVVVLLVRLLKGDLAMGEHSENIAKAKVFQMLEKMS